MVYDTTINKPINENCQTNPKSPYAATKLAGEELALSYHYAFGLPVVILRPFNTYGPFQKDDAEGGVVSIFIKNKIQGKKLYVFGTGEQTRDFLYVEDCANFIVKAAFNEKAVGNIINVGAGRDVKIKDLAMMIARDKKMVTYVEHHHPQAEIMKLVCDNKKAKELLRWTPKIKLEDGIQKTEIWLKKN